MTIRLQAALALGCLLAAAGLTQSVTPALAEDLTVAIKAPITGADPHLLYSPNRNMQLHVYEALVAQDNNLRPVPDLATSWKVINPTTWEFQLRDDVKFQDGTPLTPEDVIFSIHRAQTIEGVRTFHAYVADVASVEASGDHAVRITTKVPSPELPANLATIAIVAKHAVEGASSDDFNGGPAAIGTGPYRWVRWTPGQDVTLERSDTYRGDPAPWDHVKFRFITDDSARTAALLSGDVDVADAIPASLFQRVNNSGRAKIVSGTSVFLHYMTIDRRDNPPFVTDIDGKPVTKNPFNDLKVRQAVTHAINRDGLAERIMGGGAEPAGQFTPDGFDGHNPDLLPASYDPDQSRKLLEEAGYPDGFGLTIHCLNDRFTGDVQTCQAIAQMLTAVGIHTKVETMPSSVFWSKATGENPQFSSYLAIFGSAAGLSSNALDVLAAKWDPVAGTGRNNAGGYDNPELNALIKKATSTVDDDQRQELLQQAAKTAIDDVAIVPIFFLKGAWGVRDGLTLKPRGDMYTMATNIEPAAE
ncbi:ABC transporter substrate-binding protein [Consotaella salsifontis]|uniref:Peptide/nickel transport system substrate-binding protein n=1 Tax=Consotaella salsifontis TaxID=1365950 RepID=A0A1T4S8L4_9HYPH|nr:ABC transporter substrate-binding protein [Consotaella salsifontis]SKA24507.1 peptide/nickel transport system substrate-binding protein [Consotaella salsifontis]